MAEDQENKEDKIDFTLDAQAVGYISLEQARVLAIRHARDNMDFYGPRYSGINLVWEVISQEDGEEYYDIRLSFRPRAASGENPALSSSSSTNWATSRSARCWTNPPAWTRPKPPRSPRCPNPRQHRLNPPLLRQQASPPLAPNLPHQPLLPLQPPTWRHSPRWRGPKSPRPLRGRPRRTGRLAGPPTAGFCRLESAWRRWRS